eukprot:4030295-Prorocentrum_lima.AAC.1
MSLRFKLSSQFRQMTGVRPTPAALSGVSPSHPAHDIALRLSFLLSSIRALSVELSLLLRADKSAWLEDASRSIQEAADKSRWDV